MDDRCEHVWLWHSNWYRYCLRCPIQEYVPLGAIGVVNLPG